MLAILTLIYQKQHQGGYFKKSLHQMRQDTLDYIYENLKCYNPAKAAAHWNRTYKGKPVKIGETQKTILIRKYDLNQYLSLSNSAKPRPLAKMLDQSQNKEVNPSACMSAKETLQNEYIQKYIDDNLKITNNSQDIHELLSSPALQNLQRTSSYIDPIDLQILTRSHQIDKIYYK